MINSFNFKRGPVINNDLFYGIMGWKEYKDFSQHITKDERKDLVLISITEPEEKSMWLSVENPEFTEGYHDVLETKFWDVEYQIGEYKPLTKRQGKAIKDFIEKNKDKRFIIHCRAGMSRSAGVGKAVECIVNFDNDVYAYRTSHSDIDDFERYEYNPTVFDAICRNDEYQDV
jgi:predicted protein tyrosine phosphatase